MVTLLSADLDATAVAYHDYLGYQVVQAGVINEACAEQMGNVSVTGRSFINMQPPEGEPSVLLRFIEGADSSYQPMQATGWNAVELLAQDPDTLRDDMNNSANGPFKVVGEPAYLTAAKNIYAMQAQGPSGELLYLTHMRDPARSLLKPVMPQARVGNTFIMVMGSADLAVTRLFAEGIFKNSLTDPVPFRVDVLAKARGDAPDTRYPIMLMKFAGPFGFEFDQYAGEIEVEQAKGGIVLVSASVEALTNTKDIWARKPTDSSCPGVQGQSGLVRFPSGALLEVLAL